MVAFYCCAAVYLSHENNKPRRTMKATAAAQLPDRLNPEFIFLQLNEVADYTSKL